jgi:hypothetical protein
MGTPNQVNTLPEFPSHGDRDAWRWAVGAFSGVLLGAYSGAKLTESRISSDLHVIPAPRQQHERTVAERIINAQPLIVSPEAAAAETGGSSQSPQQREEAAKWTGSHLTNVQFIPGPDRQPQPQSVAERIQRAQPYIAPQPAEPYWPGSRAARASAANYVPDKLSPADEKLSRDETERLLAEVDKYRQQVSMPVHQEAQAEVAAPVLVAVPEAASTPLQQVEQQLPAEGPNNDQLNFKGTPVTDLLEQIGHLHDQQGNN